MDPFGQFNLKRESEQRVQWRQLAVSGFQCVKGPTKQIIGHLVNLLGFGLGLVGGLVASSIVVMRLQDLSVRLPQELKVTEVTDEARLEGFVQELPAWVRSPGLERAIWLNGIIAKLWSHLDSVVTELFEQHFWPAAKEQLLRQGIAAQLQTLTLGEVPLLIDHIKSVETLDDEVVVEMQLRLASNSSLALQVKKMGLQATVQLRELHMELLCRLHLGPLTTRFPCFAGMHICLVHQPKVHFALHVGGTDVLLLEPIQSIVTKVFQQQVASRLLWPRVWTYPLQPEALTKARHAQGTLVLTVDSASDLLHNTFAALPTPYVKATMEGSRHARTGHGEASCSPVWRQQLLLSVTNPKEARLLLTVLDYRAFISDTTLGTALLELATLPPNENKDFSLDLKTARGKPAGVLHLSAQYKPFASMENYKQRQDSLHASLDDSESDASNPKGPGMLEVHVVEAVDLEPYNGGNLHTYCKLILGSDFRISRVISHTTSPKWDEDEEFLLDAAPNKSSLLVEVWHIEEALSLMRRKEHLLGSLAVNLDDVVCNRRIIDTFQLSHAKQGTIKLAMTWRSH